MRRVRGIRRRSRNLLSRIIRWARTPWAVGGRKRRFIIIQIDGLSHTALNLALERGYMPALAALLPGRQTHDASYTGRTSKLDARLPGKCDVQLTRGHSRL